MIRRVIAISSNLLDPNIEAAACAYHSLNSAAPIESEWPVRHSEVRGNASQQRGSSRLGIVKKGEETGEILSMGYTRY